VSHEQPQVPKDQPNSLKDLSDDQLRIRMQDLFVRSFIFRIAVGLAILGAAAIGAVGISSTWITFNAENAVKQAQADLATKQ
jgi:hypothetical protein